MGTVLGFRPYRSFVFLLASVGLLVYSAQEAYADLNTAYKMAVDDLARLSPYEQYTAVYFWLGDVPVKDRPMFILTFAGHCHGLSREPSLAYFPQVVGMDNSLLRVDYTRYRWSFNVVQKLNKSHPYNTQQLVVENIPWHGGVWPGDGINYPPFFVGGHKSFSYTRHVPLVGARWFIWQTLRNNDRTPNYNEFLGLTNRQDINDLTGFNLAVQTKALRSDLVEVPRFSRIAQTYLRNVVIQPISGGWRYVTEDSKLAVAESNVLRVPDRKLAKHDAEEHIFPLPNGMPGYGLTEGVTEAKDAKIQASAPDFVGFDRSTVSNDGRIEPVGCLRCHFRAAFGGSAAIIDFTPHFRKKLSTMKQNTPDYEKAVEFERLYLRPFQHQLIIDRALYSQAIGQATGMSADEWAYRLTTIFEQYDAGATLEEAAAQLGCETTFVTGKLVQQAVQQYAYSTNQLDNVLGLFAEGELIPRVAYHEVFPVLYETLKGMEYVKKSAVSSKLLSDPVAANSKRFILQLPKHIQLSNGTVLRPSLRSTSVSDSSVQQLLSGSNTDVHAGVRPASGGNNKRPNNNVPVNANVRPAPTRPSSDSRSSSFVNTGNAGSGPVRKVDSGGEKDSGRKGVGGTVRPVPAAQTPAPRPGSTAALCPVPHGGHIAERLQVVRTERPVEPIVPRADRSVDISPVNSRPKVEDATGSKQTAIRGFCNSDGGHRHATASSSVQWCPTATAEWCTPTSSTSAASTSTEGQGRTLLGVLSLIATIMCFGVMYKYRERI